MREAIGIRNSGPGIGDKIQFSSFPENIYRNTGIKVIDLDHSWVFDHNPYVVRDQEPDRIADCWFLGHSERFNPGKAEIVFSVAERTCNFVGLKCFLRHPRLYRFEDIPRIPNQVAVHTTGKSSGPIPDHVIQKIAENYAGYQIVQVGHPDDKPTHFIDRRSTNIWDSAQAIAESAIFIGPNSGLMHIANCYPRVSKKIVLFEISADYIAKLIPLKSDQPGWHWLEIANQYFNATSDDIGITFSYSKI